VHHDPRDEGVEYSVDHRASFDNEGQGVEESDDEQVKNILEWLHRLLERLAQVFKLYSLDLELGPHLRDIAVGWDI
jgi:hypothetical protein